MIHLSSADKWGKGDLRKPCIATRLNRQNGTLTEVKSCVYYIVPLTTEHCEGPLATNNAFYAIDCKSPPLVHKTAFVLAPKLPACCNTICQVTIINLLFFLQFNNCSNGCSTLQIRAFKSTAGNPLRSV